MKKFNLKKLYLALEKQSGLMLGACFSVFILSFFLGSLAGNGYYHLQKKKMIALKQAQKMEETKKIEKIFAGFPEKKFLQMIKQK